MMGRQTTPERLFYDFCLEDQAGAASKFRRIARYKKACQLFTL
jgi:hypothetical protein